MAHERDSGETSQRGRPEGTFYEGPIDFFYQSFYNYAPMGTLRPPYQQKYFFLPLGAFAVLTNSKSARELSEGR